MWNVILVWQERKTSHVHFEFEITVYQELPCLLYDISISRTVRAIRYGHRIFIQKNNLIFADSLLPSLQANILEQTMGKVNKKKRSDHGRKNEIELGDSNNYHHHHNKLNTKS